MEITTGLGLSDDQIQAVMMAVGHLVNVRGNPLTFTKPQEVHIEWQWPDVCAK